MSTICQGRKGEDEDEEIQRRLSESHGGGRDAAGLLRWGRPVL
jgi:hypothetical protein